MSTSDKEKRLRKKQVCFFMTEKDKEVWRQRADYYEITFENWMRLALRRAAGLPSATFDRTPPHRSLGSTSGPETKITFRCTQEELDAIDKAVSKTHDPDTDKPLSRSAWMREVLRAEAGQYSMLAA